MPYPDDLDLARREHVFVLAIYTFFSLIFLFDVHPKKYYK